LCNPNPRQPFPTIPNEISDPFWIPLRPFGTIHGGKTEGNGHLEIMIMGFRGFEPQDEKDHPTLTEKPSRVPTPLSVATTGKNIERLDPQPSRILGRIDSFRQSARFPRIGVVSDVADYGEPFAREVLIPVCGHPAVVFEGLIQSTAGLEAHN
jgi:hypothetical protein